MMKVGITGGMASGKTTASDIFSELGVQVLDADVIAHQLMAADGKATAAIIEHFGESVRGLNGAIDRCQLRQLVVETQQLQWLENYLHPLIAEVFSASIKASPVGYVLMSVPLLFETGFDSMVDSCLLIDIDEETQWHRIMKRPGAEKGQMRALLARQMSREQRLACGAEKVVDGSLSQADFRQEIIALDRWYRQNIRKNCV